MENYRPQEDKNLFFKEIDELFNRGNIAQAEILTRIYLEKYPKDAKAYNTLGEIAFGLNLYKFANNYYSIAARLEPDWKTPQTNLAKVNTKIKENNYSYANGRLTIRKTVKTEQFLLIRAWGFGFWSDISHVLGQLLVAEISGRIPVVHWGSNSLFGDRTEKNAFEFYFENVSAFNVSDLQNKDFNFWPPKWNCHNLTGAEINKWGGFYSRLAGIFFLNRPEKVLVSDFYTGVFDLIPWIPATHTLYGLSLDELYRHLISKYLRPRNKIMNEVNTFYANHLASGDFIAMHVRGSDKAFELNGLDEANKQYRQILDHHLSEHNYHRIFLMTDDSRILEYFTKLYDNKIVTTNCRRTNNDKGVHYLTEHDGLRLGMEVMVDSYLAAKSKRFIGNGFSNPSLIVKYLKDWPEEDVHLIGDSMYQKYNTAIHNW